MSEVRWTQRPEHEGPILVMALEGLFDIASAATDAVTHLTDRAATSTPLCSIDPEIFFDFTQQRPTVSLDDDGARIVEWPSAKAHEITLDGADRSVIAMTGIEPHLRWRTFSEAVGEVASECGARLVVTLGAMAGMAPHTRPLGVIGSASDPALAERLGLGRPSYQGPTGLVGALHVHLHAAGLAVISLRVSVPHYVTQSPNPEATRSLLARLELVTGVPTGHRDFDDAARSWQQQVDAAVANDDDMRRYVAQLESQVDQTEDLLPSGDSIAAELQAWLRDNE